MQFSFILFSHMRFVDKADYKQSANNGSVNAFGTYKIKSIFLLKLDFAL